MGSQPTSETEPIPEFIAPDLYEVLGAIGGRSDASAKYQRKYAGKYGLIPDEDKKKGGGGGGGSRYESGWTRELSEAEYTQRVEAARKSAEARRVTEVEAQREIVKGMSPLEKARYAAELEVRARDKLAELQRRFDASKDQAERAALQGQMDEIRATLALGDQWLAQAEDEEREVLDEEIRRAEAAAEREQVRTQMEIRREAEKVADQAERRQERIRDEAEKLDKQADKLEERAARLESEAAYQPTVIGQIMARNQAAKMREQSSNLRKARDRRMKRRERGYEEWTDRVEDRMKELQRDAERRSMEVRRQLEQMRLRRERRLEQYSEARDYLSRSREKERSSSTYFF